MCRDFDNVAVHVRWPLTTAVAQGRYYCTTNYEYIFSTQTTNLYLNTLHKFTTPPSINTVRSRPPLVRLPRGYSGSRVQLRTFTTHICHSCSHSCSVAGWEIDMSCSVHHTVATYTYLQWLVHRLHHWTDLPPPKTVSVRCWPRACFRRFAWQFWRVMTCIAAVVSLMYHVSLVSTQSDILPDVRCYLVGRNELQYACILFNWRTYIFHGSILEILICQYHRTWQWATSLL